MLKVKGFIKEGEEASLLRTKIVKEYLQKGIFNSFRNNFRKYSVEYWALYRLKRLVLWQPSDCSFTNELHPQLMEATSVHQAAARQFQSTTWNVLLAVNFVICFICSSVLLNCFLFSSEFKYQLHLPGHQLKEPTKAGSLILTSEIGLDMIADLHLSCLVSNYISWTFWLPQVL